jgi:predicted lipid-binding transport protein (Tim44 family)
MTRASLIFFEHPTRLLGSRGARRSDFDEGLRDIRRTDAGFDPTRFAGYAGMMFRDAQLAWTSRDFGSLRDRIMRALHSELQTRSEAMRARLRVNRVEEVEITAEVTEASQEDGRDYVTAHITGSLVDYTIDEVGGGVVEGSATVPRAVQEFWTFTRPAGLNFWMLSAIET